MKLNDQTEERVPLRVFETWHETETVNGTDSPIIYCKCRDEHREPWLVAIEEFDPYFHVPLPLCSEDTVEALRSSPRVESVEMGDSAVLPYNRRDVVDEEAPFAQTRTLRVETAVPYDVRELRENFTMTGEADVRFPQRFLVDQGIRAGMTVPQRARTERITPSDIEPCNEHPVTRIRPRIVYYDIEVETSDRGPSVVSEKGTAQARNPITAIAMTDNYTSESEVYVLANDAWESIPDDEDMHVYTEESDMLTQFCGTIRDRRPDVLTGWNSGGFDDPYLVNRCLREDVTAVQTLSPTGNVDRMGGEGKWRNSDLRGIILFDLLQGYKNISRRELDSFSLANVAASEGIAEKLDVDEQWAYEHDPATFVEYVERDCTILRDLNEQCEIV